MLIDELDLILKAGHGGAGKVSFYPGRYGGPDGGNGGKGGDIYFKTTSDLSALSFFAYKKQFEAENGHDGESNLKSGKNAKDLELIVPIGTTLIDERDGEIIELSNLDDKILICKGGLGGRGNYEFRSSTNTTPKYAQPGLNGQERHFKVILKLIADFGLIGLPNAGKSSLLNELTRAKAKVGDYPFTTLEPNLGVINGKIIADIPGLIEGASQGKGLGIKFLKHIEKVGLLFHCISAQSTNVKRDYQTVKNELKKYSSELAQKKEIILLTKSDLIIKEALKEKIKLLKGLKKTVLPISIHDWDSLENLKKILI